MISEQVPTKRRWVIFNLAAATSFILYLHRYTWLLVRPEIKEEFKFNDEQMGGLDMAFNLTYMIGQIPGGMICDFFGPHLFLGIIIALWSLAMPMLGLTGSLYGLGASRLAFGAAQAGCYPSLAKVTRVWFPFKGRTLLQGWIASFFGRSGGALSATIFGLMLGLGLTWRSALWVYSGVGLVFAVVFLIFCKNSPEDDPAANEAEIELIRDGDPGVAKGVLPFWRAMRNRSLRVFTVQQFMNAGADFFYSILIASYFIEARGVVDKLILGLLASLPLWGGAFGGVVGGVLNDALIRKTGNRRFARSAVGFTGKIFACVFFYFAATNGNAMVCAWLLGATKFFSDWTQPTVWGTSTDLGGRYSATVFSIINTAGSIGGIAAPVMSGFLLERYKTEAIIDGELTKIANYQPVFIMVGTMYMVSALCWLFIDCTNSLDDPKYSSDGTLK